jgi:uncharacterized protein YjbI with pentapeptide repeats
MMDANKILSRYSENQRDFSRLDLRGQSFKNKVLNGAIFTGAKLNGVDFSGAKINDARFDNADIRGTNFTGSELNHAVFKGAIVGTQTRWFFLMVIGLFFALVLSSFPIALAFWWIPSFLNRISSAPVFIVYAVVILIAFIALFATRKTENVIPLVFSIAAINAGLFGVYGITISGSPELCVGMVIYVFALATGGVASTAGAAILRSIYLMSKNVITLTKIPKFLKNNTKITTTLVFTIFVCLSFIASGVLTGKCAEVIISKKVLEAAITLLKANLSETAVIITGFGGVLSVLFSVIIYLFIDNDLSTGQKILDFIKKSLKALHSKHLSNLCQKPFAVRVSRVLSCTEDNDKYKMSKNVSNDIMAFKGTNFKSSQLNNADFSTVDLYCTNFEDVKAIQANWSNTHGHNRVKGWIPSLQDQKILDLATKKSGDGNFVGENLEGINLENADLRGFSFDNANLTNANLQNTILVDASFIDANLTKTSLGGANLTGAKLVRTNLHDADLTGTILTGACIDTWGYTALTKLANIDCEYIETKYPDKESGEHDPHRQPHERNFEKGEFVAYIKEYFDTLDFFYGSDFDFMSFYKSILKVQEEYPDCNTSFGSMKMCGEDKWLIKVPIDPKADREKARDSYNRHYHNLFLSNQQKQQLIKALVNQTEDRVLLSLGKGNCLEGFSSVRVSINLVQEGYEIRHSGKLSANPELPNLYQELMNLYLPTKEQEVRAKRKYETPSNFSVEDMKKHNEAKEKIKKTEDKLKQNINQWLDSNDFAPILDFIRKNLVNSKEEVLICIETEQDLSDPNFNDYTLLRKLPWHLWEFLDEYENTELAFTRPENNRSEKVIERDHVRVLSILGDDIGIDIQEDKRLLEHYLANINAEICFLEQENKHTVLETLNDINGWDVITFSGHRSLKWDELSINRDETISANELLSNLSQAVQNGLQLVILNACDTLRLAKELEKLHIPQVIVMKENIPDIIAHQFLDNFLKFFKDNSVALSLRKTRKELAKNDSIGSWIPVLCQNAAERQVTLKDLPRH